MIAGFPPFCRFLSQIEDLQNLFKSSQWRSLTGLDIDPGLGDLVFELAGFRGERFLVDPASQISVQKALLHFLKIGQTAFERLGPFGSQQRIVLERSNDAVAEPLPFLVVFNADRTQVGENSLLQVFLPPAELGVVSVGIYVATAVVDVLAYLATLVFSADAFGCDAIPTMGTNEHARGQVVIDLVAPAVLAFEQCLALVEGILVDDWLVLADKQFIAEPDQPGVVWVVENVGNRRSAESWYAWSVNKSLTIQNVGNLFKRHRPGGIKFKDAANGFAFFRMWVDRPFLVCGHVHVSVGRKPGRPALPDAFFDPLEYLLSQVVGIVLGDRCHDVERQGTCCPAAELIVDEGELDAMLVFDLLHAHRVFHVAADAVEFMGQDIVDVLSLGVGNHPSNHVVKRNALRTTLGRFCDDKFTDNFPTFTLSPFAGDPQLGIDGIAFTLFAR